MSEHDLRALLTQLRYKPGWHFRVDASGDIVVTARVQDAYHRGHRTSVRSYVVVNKHWRRATVLKETMEAIEALEFHEAREWFCYKGRRPFDPHAD